jgi:hypothetical protein
VLKKLGSVYLYYLDSRNDWVFSERILSGGGYGHSVGASLNALAVGAPWNDIAADDTGTVFVFEVTEDTCDVSTEDPTYSPTGP